MTNTVTPIAEAALNRLGITHRDLPCRNGEFYFCTIPSTGTTFDLQCGEDDTIRLWRFVDTTSLSKAGMRCEYRKPSHPHTVIGLEVTDEGDVSLYAEQRIDGNAPQRESRIVRMIEGYTSMVSNMDFEKFTM